MIWEGVYNKMGTVTKVKIMVMDNNIMVLARVRSNIIENFKLRKVF